MKVNSLLRSMNPLKLSALLTGLLWVVLIDCLLIRVFPVASLFFLISAGLQVLLTKVVIGIYLYQLMLIQQVDVSAPIVKTRITLARLTASTLWVTRVLVLQLPLWTAFYLTRPLLENGTGTFYLVQTLVTLTFTAVAVWLFLNIKYTNRDKRWFQLLFKGNEWTPVLKSMELLSQIVAYQSGTKADAVN